MVSLMLFHPWMLSVCVPVEFFYDLDGTGHYLTINQSENEQQHSILAGDVDGFLVKCDVQLTAFHNEMSSIDILVKPYWSPRGASQFLELVRRGYYDGVALNRVVPQFLIQFGIARDVELRRAHRDESPILDDEASEDTKFEPGYVSYAGSGPDSRTTEVFIVMPDTDEEQLEYFGTNSWETPFGYVQDVGILTKIFSGYGDMPPGGNGELVELCE
jgi:cyclophilin family peptidyl-prolyl cis-trans isomerase